MRAWDYKYFLNWIKQGLPETDFVEEYGVITV
jgi:hypothetical protein